MAQSERRADGQLSAIVLAAGEGKRMRSKRPKPLHVLCGRPLVEWVIAALADCRADQIAVVVGHGGDQVAERLSADLPELQLEFPRQEIQRGTADAVAVGLAGLDESLDESEDVLVMLGDTPLLRASTIAALVAQHRTSGSACTLLTSILENPAGYGRVVRDGNDRVVKITEHVDATAEELEITEINTGIMCFRRSLLAPALRRIEPSNAQGELYVTDAPAVLADAGHLVTSIVVDDPAESLGVNDRVQLAAAETELRRRINTAHLRAGVTILDPAATHVDATVELAPDVTLYTGTILQGRTRVESGARIGPNTHLVDTVVGAGAVVRHSVAESAKIEPGAEIGPFAHLSA